MIRYIVAWLLAYMEAWANRVEYVVLLVTSPPKHRMPSNGDLCPLCGHQLGAPEQRPPRDTRTRDGKMKRLPAEVLSWRRCGGCGLHQQGRPASDTMKVLA